MIQAEPDFLERQGSCLPKVADEPLLLFVFLDLDLERPDHPYGVLLDGRNHHLGGLREGKVQVVHHVLDLPIRPWLVLELEGEGHPLAVHVRLEISIRGPAALVAAIRPARPPPLLVQFPRLEPRLDRGRDSGTHLEVAHPKDAPQVGFGLEGNPDLLDFHVVLPFIWVDLDGVFGAPDQ